METDWILRFIDATVKNVVEGVGRLRREGRTLVLTVYGIYSLELSAQGVGRGLAFREGFPCFVLRIIGCTNMQKDVACFCL